MLRLGRGASRRRSRGFGQRLAQLEEAGATEIAFQPAGPDPVRELEAFASAARGG
jgi:5,10-methylenetetrahydromethanopterin reductase